MCLLCVYRVLSIMYGVYCSTQGLSLTGLCVCISRITPDCIMCMYLGVDPWLYYWYMSQGWSLMMLYSVALGDNPSLVDGYVSQGLSLSMVCIVPLRDNPWVAYVYVSQGSSLTVLYVFNICISGLIPDCVIGMCLRDDPWVWCVS